MKLTKWVIALLNKDSMIAKLFCQLGLLHSFVVVNNNTICKHCKKPIDRWDVFTWFDI